MTDDTSVERLAGDQCGVFTRAQALDAGVSPSQIGRRLRCGAWERLTPTVYALASAPPTTQRLEWAAALAGGDGAALGFCSAARRWRLPAPSCERVHLIVVRQRHPRVPRGVVIHRLVLSPEDVVLIEGIRTTSRVRSVEDCLREFGADVAATLLDRSLQQGWVSLEQLSGRAHEARGRAGNRQLRRLLAAADPAAAAASERLLHRLLHAAGIEGWVPGYRLASGHELDVAFPCVRAAIEVDGWAWHSDSIRFQRDRDKQNALMRAGWVVLRFTWHDLVERPDYVVVTVRAALAPAA